MNLQGPRGIGLSLSGLGLVGACAAAPSAAPPATLEIARAPAPAVAPPPAAKLTMRSALAPAGLAIDGDLGEWGPSAGPSSVRVAFTSEGAVAAAELDEGGAEGFWLGLASIMMWEPGPNGTTCAGLPADEGGARACAESQRAFEAFVADYKKLFERLYRVSPAGVQVLRDDGSLAPVPLAKVAWRPNPRGATAEISLPASALPRTDQAPLQGIRLLGSTAAKLAHVARKETDWAEAQLESPVSFEPNGRLRAAVFRAVAERPCDDRFSYQPGDASQVFGAWSGPHPLYEKKASLGAVEVGVALRDPTTCIMFGSTGGPAEWSLVVVRRGAETLEAFSVRKVDAILERSGELHLFSFASGYSEGEGYDFGYWTVTVVSADGSLRDGVLREAAKAPGLPGTQMLTGAKEFHDAGYKTLGLRGPLFEDLRAGKKPPRWIETKWRWDPKAKAYTGKSRLIPAP